ncbi:homoserine kinase [Hutsoniella sourekii]
MVNQAVQFKIPATSANLGLGFDSMGIALNKFLTVEVEAHTDWLVEFLDDELTCLPNDESNLVIKTARQVAKRFGHDLDPVKVTMSSQIPLTHGQGSSSSAIVAGIEIANYFADLNLDPATKIMIGSELEGHPDNIGPCVTGSVFVGAYVEGELYYHVIEVDDLGLVLSVPPYEIATEEARKAIPQTYAKQVAVNQNALNNVLVLKLLAKNYEQVGQLMMKDQFHEPYRQNLIQEFQAVKETALSAGAYATVISGAGPSILTIASQEQVAQVYQMLQAAFPGLNHERVSIYTGESKT